MDILTSVFYKKNRKIPIWFMRQAGRYMPEYMDIRNNTENFLDLCYNSKKASTVTMQPINRFDFDAAILFSDILVLPDALGWDVRFEKGEGPILKKFKSEKDLEIINKSFLPRIENVYETVEKVRSKLPKEKSLIGFAGSPWTVASYMLEGRGKQSFAVSKNFLYTKNKLAKSLIDIITEKTIEYLSGQIKAGAQIIQLFDSWSGMLNGIYYEDFVLEPTKKIILELKKQHPDTPVIGFPKGSGYNYDKYIDYTGINGLGVDQFTPLSQMRKWQEKLVVQGNFDPVLLLGSKEVISNEARKILDTLDNKNFIFNLGHGILKETPVENVEHLVNFVKNYGK